MTISTEPAPLSYNGNGSTTDFSITWKYFAKSHVVATLRSSAGAETVWVLNTDYTLTAANVDAGGTLTAIVAPASGETLVITLEPPNTQSTSLPLGGAFPSASVESALDVAAQRDSKNKNILNLALRVPKTDAQMGSNLELPIDTLRAGKFLAFDSSGKPIASVGSSDSLGPVTSFANTLLDDPDASTMLSTLGVSAFAKTLLDDTSASTALSTLGVSAFAKTILDDADAGTARTTLGALASSAVSAFGLTLIDDADATTALATLGLVSSTVPLGVLKAGFVNLPQGATRFLGVVGGPGESTEANAEYWVPRPITVSQMRAKLSANVAASQTIAVTLRKNGADTSCTFTISAGASTGEDTSNSVNFSTGDRLAIKVVTSASFGTTTDIGLTLKTSLYNTSIGTTLGLCFNTIGHGTTTAASFGEPGGNTNSGNEARAEVPLSAVILGRTFISSITAGAIAVVNKNATTISKVVLDSDSDFDPGEYLFAANDLYNIRKTTTASEVCAGYVRLENPPGAAFNFAPCPTIFTSITQAQNTTFYMGGYQGVASTTESDVQIPMPACTIRNFRAAADAAPPGGQSCTLTLRKNGVDTAITCTITSAGRTSSDTSNSVTFAAGDLLTIKCVSSATAGTLTYNVSLEPYV